MFTDSLFGGFGRATLTRIVNQYFVTNPPPTGPAGPAGPQGAPGPAGATGAQGAQGSPGAVGATGAQGPVGATGAAGAQGQKGDTGAQGPQGPKGDTGATGAQGVAGPTISPGSPATKTAVFGTVYQSSTPTKPTFISAMIDVSYTVSLASTLADIVELRIGATATGLADGSGGISVASFRSSLTGLLVVVGMGTGDRGQLCYMLPPGWYYCIRRVAGTTATISSALEQPLG